MYTRLLQIRTVPNGLRVKLERRSRHAVGFELEATIPWSALLDAELLPALMLVWDRLHESADGGEDPDQIPLF